MSNQSDQNCTDHNCQEVINKVYLCLDGEMSPTEEKSFLQEIQNCSGCLERYNIEKSFKQFLTNKIERKSVSQQLVTSIRKRIETIPSQSQ